MVAAWIVLNILDLALTSQAIGNGAVEGNPVLAMFLSHSFTAFAVVKLTAAGLVVGIYLALGHHKKIAYSFASGNILIAAVVIYEISNLI